jgi:4a-hydroxytetrahydrobiopterin dehydratase
MSDAITATDFHDADGVDDWRVVFGGACAHFVTGSFSKGVALVEAIGRLADEANHHPDVDLRYGGVTVKLISHDIGGLSRRDLALAREISGAASGLDVEADPGLVQTVELGIDAHVSADVVPFWRTLLGYRAAGETDLVDARGRAPAVWFQKMEEKREGRNRIHVDVSVPHDQAEARLTAALAAGGELVTDEHAPAWWVLRDAEGNEACLCTWQGRD